MLWAGVPWCMESCRLDKALSALTSHCSPASPEFFQTLFKTSSSSSLCLPGNHAVPVALTRAWSCPLGPSFFGRDGGVESGPEVPEGSSP